MFKKKPKNHASPCLQSVVLRQILKKYPAKNKRITKKEGMGKKGWSNFKRICNIHDYTHYDQSRSPDMLVPWQHTPIDGLIDSYMDGWTDR